MYTIGGSAGGTLALGIANQVVRDPTLKPSLKGIVAMVPATTHWDNVPSKYASMYTSYKDNELGTPVIDKESMEIFYKHVEAKPDGGIILYTAMFGKGFLTSYRLFVLHYPRHGQAR